MHARRFFFCTLFSAALLGALSAQAAAPADSSSPLGTASADGTASVATSADGALTADVSASGAGTPLPSDAVSDAGTAPAASPAPAFAQHAFFVTAGPLLLVNTDSESAPSPLMFSVGMGASLWQQAPLGVQSRISFFTNYYLWRDDEAYPAEIENRTALALSALLDVCAVKTWMRRTQLLQAGAGAAVLARLAAQANGVSGADDEVKSIQRWFWQSYRWLYPELVFSWLHRLPQGRLSAGLEMRFYLPLGSLLSGDGMDAALISTAFKFSL